MYSVPSTLNMCLLTIQLFFLLIIPIFIDAQSDPIVELPTGTIRGITLTAYNGSNFFAFKQIPYASPPVGNLRYKEPQPPRNWSGILNTTSGDKICHQNGGANPDDPRQTEDCLYLSVYTPASLNQTSDLPVFFWIHGGAFQNGDGAGWATDFWINEGIIVVIMNYRLGPFGFLTTEDNVIPANLGLKDQVAALKWVNQNIHLFGGDPSKITIGGQSAGAASVGYLILSPLAKGLFRAGILESGSSLCAWSYARRSRQYAYDFANVLNSSISNETTSEELLEYLLSVDELTLRNAHLDFDWLRGDGPYGWSPVIEDANLETAFLTGKQDELLQSGNFNQVPIIIGVNSEEEVANAASLDDFYWRMLYYDNDFSLIVHEGFNINPSNVNTFGEKLRKIYTNGLFEDDLGNGIRYWSDTRFTIGTIRHAASQSRHTPVYFYQFNYEGQLGNVVNYTVPGIGGNVGHSGELGYFWYANNDLNNYSEADVLTHRRSITLWSNFIKYLDPTPKYDPLFGGLQWLPVSEDNFVYLDINTNLTLKTDPKEYKAWKVLVDTYGSPPFDVY